MAWAEHDGIMDRFAKDLTKIARVSSVKSATRVVRGTRKYSGQARSSTRLGVKRQDLSVTIAQPYVQNAFTGEVAKAERRFNRAAKRIKLGNRVYVSNNLHYIAVLEFQYGDLMFVKAAKHWQADVDSAAKEVRNAA